MSIVSASKVEISGLFHYRFIIRITKLLSLRSERRYPIGRLLIRLKLLSLQKIKE